MHLIIQNASLTNQKCMIQPTLIYLHPNEYTITWELNYYPFSVKLYRCVGNCNILNDWRFKEDLNIRRFEYKLVRHDNRDNWIKNINIQQVLSMIQRLCLMIL